jgi:hypothetical protein
MHSSVDTMLMAKTIEDMPEWVPVALAGGELNAVVGEHRMSFVGHGGDQMP